MKNLPSKIHEEAADNFRQIIDRMKAQLYALENNILSYNQAYPP